MKKTRVWIDTNKHVDKLDIYIYNMQYCYTLYKQE